MLFNFMQQSPLRDPDPNPGGGGNPSNPPAGGPPNPGAGAFDPAALESKMLDSINKGINGIERRLEAKFQKMLQPNPPTPNAGDPPVNPDPLANGLPTSPELAVKALQIQLNNEKAEREKQARTQTELQATVNSEKAMRVKAERDAIGSKALGGIKWAEAQNADDAFEILVPKIKFSEELGKWVGPDDVTPAGDWIRAQALARKSWQAPVETNPAGAKPGAHTNGSGKWTLDDLNGDRFYSLSPADQQAARTQAITALRESAGG